MHLVILACGFLKKCLKHTWEKFSSQIQVVLQQKEFLRPSRHCALPGLPSQLQISVVLHHTKGVPERINRGSVMYVHCTVQVPDVLNQNHAPFEKI